MALSPSRNLDEVLDHLPQYMEIAAVPGLAMTIIADHQVASTYAFGVKSAATQEPVAADTVFQAASLSKPVFAYAVLSLYDQGLIDLDRPLSDYLPAACLRISPSATRTAAMAS